MRFNGYPTQAAFSSNIQQLLQNSRDIRVTLKFHMQARHANRDNIACVWLDPTNPNQLRTTGCTLTDVVAVTATCLCTHTTSFALLERPDIVVAPVSKWPLWAFRVGSAVSAALLCIAMVTLMYIRRLQTKRIIIMRCLCLTLCLAQTLWIVATFVADAVRIRVHIRTYQKCRSHAV